MRKYIVTCPTAGKPLFCEFAARREIDGERVSYAQIVGRPCDTEQEARAIFEDVAECIGVDLWLYRGIFTDPVRLASSYDNF